MDKPDNVRLLEALGVDCWWSERLEQWMCFPPGRLDRRMRAAKFDGDTESWWRLWLLEEMEKRRLKTRFVSACAVFWGDTKWNFATLSNECLMRAALAVLEDGPKMVAARKRGESDAA